MNNPKTLDDLVNPSPEDIIRFVAEQHRLAAEDLIGRSRRADIVEARDIAVEEMYVRLRHMNLTDIGIKLNGRNYATIKAALERRKIDVPISGIIDREVVVEDAKAGMSIEDMAYKHHCSRHSIQRILYGAKAQLNPDAAEVA
ncbi:MAG: helix-turn-helix domain-containing protein [Phyllobacterium sp.]|uniref:helix-turn-helix domain-containing protein n=1 Tax=Phyllobacterium sp. TaxID=1871046 RepID=UPI0030F0C440